MSDKDTICRQAAIDAMEESKRIYVDRRVIIGKMQDIVSNLPSAQPLVIHCTDCEDWFERQSILGVTISELSSAQPEPLTDKEQRIFLAAMGREEKVCKHKDSLVRVCHEIERKVKGALWT